MVYLRWIEKERGRETIALDIQYSMAQSLDFTICEFLQQNSCHQYHAIHIGGDIIPSIFMECL